MFTMCFPPTFLLLLTLTPYLLASGPSVTPMQVSAHPSIIKHTPGQPPEVTTSGSVEMANNTEPLTTTATAVGVMTQKRRTPEVTTAEGETSEVTTAEGETSEVTTAEGETSEVTTAEGETSEVTTTEGETSEVMIPVLTTRQRSTITTTTTTQKINLKATPLMKNNQQISVKVTDPPSRIWIVVILCLIFITLLILLVSACRKLQEFGGQGSYYPCHLDRERYVNAEEGEGTEDGQPRAMRRVFLSAVCRILPWKSSPLLGNDEDDEVVEWEEGGGEEEGVEGEVVQGRGSSEAQPAEDIDHSDSDDYSSLGGLDLRERAVQDEESEEKGQEEGSDKQLSESDQPGHHSPSGDELLSDIHSFSGTAQWSDTNHDITAL